MSRIEALIAAMTLPEKLGQLTMTASGYAVTGPIIAGDSTQAIRDGTIGNLLNLVGGDHVHEVQRLAVEESRLGVPLLIGFDAIHGHRTMFPVPLGEAAVFDPAIWELTARETARESAADGLAMVFAPMIDVSRDPRWGRSVEGPGEDPFVAVQIARAKVRGFQGADLGSGDAMAACAKHYCAYGPVTAGREYAPVDISERTLREVHLPSFNAAVAAGVASIMPAFTDLNGVPMTANVALLRGWLRDTLGFEGVIVSDYNAIAELIRHGVAADLVEAAVLALRAGVDIDMMADAYRHGLPAALERGLVTIDEIDTALRRVLLLKEQLGLFDDPYRRGGTPEPAGAVAHRQKIAREVGAKAIVMLKNEGALPLPATARRIAVVGPLADAAREMRGPWAAAAGDELHVSVLAGIRAALPDATVVHAEGVTIDGTSGADIAAAAHLCEDADIVLLCLGEAANMSGEAASRANLDLPGRQRSFAEVVLDRCAGRNVPVVAVLFSGRPLVVPWLAERADAVLAAWFLGSQAGNAVADVVTGRVSPSGRTPVTWARSAGQVPIFYGERPSGRPDNPDDHYTSKYLDVANAPLFPFGHGLTYGRFALSNLRVTPERVRESDTIEVAVDVANVGAHAAEETVFLFVHDTVASVARPVLELKGFAKIALRPGEHGTVRLQLAASDLRFLGLDLRPVFEPGTVEILVGPCADRAHLLVAEIALIAA